MFEQNALESIPMARIISTFSRTTTYQWRSIKINNIVFTHLYSTFILFLKLWRLLFEWLSKQNIHFIMSGEVKLDLNEMCAVHNNHRLDEFTHSIPYQWIEHDFNCRRMFNYLSGQCKRYHLFKMMISVESHDWVSVSTRILICVPCWLTQYIKNILWTSVF